MPANLMARAWRALGHVAVRNALFLYGVQISGYIFPLITLPYLSRVLSPDKIGLIALATYFMWYFNSLTDYGFNLTATRRIAIHKESPEEVNHIFSAVMMAKGFLTAVGFVLMMAIVLASPKYRAHWPLFPLAFLTVVGGWLFPMWLYQGFEKMGQVAARDFIAKFLAAALTLLAVRHESDYVYAIAFQSGAALIAGAISLAWAPAVCGVRFRWLPWKEVWALLKQDWPVFLSMAAGSNTSNTNMFILGVIAPASEAAYFSNANRLVVNMRMLVTPIVTALYPHVSHMASKSAGGTIAFLRKYSLLMALPFLAMGAVAFIFAPFIVHKFFGTKYDYTPCILLLRIMAIQPFLLALSHSYSTYYMLAFGFAKQWSRIILRATVLNFALLGVLVWIVKMRAINAMSIISTLLDLFVLVSSYVFFRMNTRPTRAEMGEPAATRT